MAFPAPDALFDRLARRVPLPPAVLLAGAGVGLLGASAAIAFHHGWIGAGLLLAGLAAAGLGQAQRPAVPVLPLGLLAVPFGFGLADPSRALAAMFLTFALAVLAVLVRPGVSPVILLVSMALLLACIFPDRFSLFAYVVGVACFIAAGQGAARAAR